MEANTLKDVLVLTETSEMTLLLTAWKYWIQISLITLVVILISFQLSGQSIPARNYMESWTKVNHTKISIRLLGT